MLSTKPTTNYTSNSTVVPEMFAPAAVAERYDRLIYIPPRIKLQADDVRPPGVWFQ